MRILIVATTRFGMDGITNVIMNYYKAMNKSDLEIDFVLPNHPSDDVYEIIRNNKGNIYVLNHRLKHTFLYILKLNKILNNFEYDIIHVHGNSHTLAIEMVLAKINKVPVRISHAHNTTTNFKTIHHLLTKIFNSSYTHGLACGNDAGKWLFEKKEFEVLNNGINVKMFKYDLNMRKELRKELGYNNDNKLIGHVGHFTKQKNQEYLIDLFSEIYEDDNTYRLLLIGDGALRGRLEDKVKSLNLSHVIVFAGNRKDIPKLMSTIDLLVMPSLFEGLPLTLIEAQSADLKCLVSNNISSEVNITGNINFFDLNDTYSNVILKIKQCFLDKQDRRLSINNNQMIKSEYNILERADKLRDLYFNYFQEKKNHR